jgi:hypothetical protein
MVFMVFTFFVVFFLGRKHVFLGKPPEKHMNYRGKIGVDSIGVEKNWSDKNPPNFSLQF